MSAPRPQPFLHEQELLIHISTGDEAAFRQLFDLYRDNIYTTVLRITGLDWLAEEVLCDSFLKVWLKRQELPAIDNFGGWLYTIASRLAINAINDLARRRQQQAGLAMTTTHSAVPSGEGLLEVKEYEGLLHEAVQSLSDRQREAWQLIREQGLQRKEAAEQMHVSPETVKYHFELALRNVRSFCLSRIDPATWAILLLLLGERDW